MSEKHKKTCTWTENEVGDIQTTCEHLIIANSVVKKSAELFTYCPFCSNKLHRIYHAEPTF